MGKKKGKARQTANLAHNQNGLPVPEAKEVGNAIGKALAEVIARKVKAQQNINGEDKLVTGLARQAEISNPLLRPEIREATTPPKMLDVRTPDAQRITWTFLKLNPNEAGPNDDPLAGGRSVPGTALWRWTINEHVWVVAQYEFGKEVGSLGNYSVSIEFKDRLKRLRGTAHDAKRVAEALLSASDWETSWFNVMGKPGQNTREAYQDYGDEIV